MTNDDGAVAPVDGRFRPESISHFKEVAKNLSWLLERPLQKCQEDLARIYKYSGLHELQQVLKKRGVPGPFAPRYGDLSSNSGGLIENHERRIFAVLFGAPKGPWRDFQLAQDQSFLVFEMGLFQEAAEHRACFEKIRQVLTYQVSTDRWPLIHGWPLGLRSWLASGYTEPLDLVEGWTRVLPRSEYFPVVYADIRWQRRMTGLERLATMFQILAPRVGGRKPNGMGRVVFDQFDDDAGGIIESSWEGHYLGDWLTKKLSHGTEAATAQQKKLIQAFVQRPSRATAIACEFAKDLKDPAGFRDRWAFESIKSSLDSYSDGAKALFSSSLDDGAIQSLFLHMDGDSACISEGAGCQIWQLHLTWNETIDPVSEHFSPALQPVIHANGSLIVPFDSDLGAMSSDEWYLSHDDSEFASEAAASAFQHIYLSAIGVRRLDFVHQPDPYSIIEIDELLVASHVSDVTLKAYFQRLIDSFDDHFLPDSYGYWTNTLCLGYEDDEQNSERNQDGEYADYVHRPAVLLINIDGCGLTFVEAQHQNGKLVSKVTHDLKKEASASRAALAALVIEAVKGLPIDVVVYDGDL